MRHPDNNVRLHHMLDAAEKARAITQGCQRKDLDSNETLALALVRLVEIIGEAANGISSDFKESYTEIPWKQMIGARNHLIHGYFDVDYDVIWQIVQTDLPSLIKNLKELLK
ncbi:MAG: DUF86 domain-containing protein [Elusimicrobia bacterium]|nr:DUF86 domain-containing protein [Elusimicrobiota bacterium]